MLLQPVADPHVLDEVGRVRQARLAGPVVEDLQAGRARHEVDAVAAEVGVRVAVAVEERERLRGVGDRPFDDVAREEDPPVGGLGQAVVEQPLAHAVTADLHAGLGEDPLRLVEDPGDEVVVEDLERRSHRTSIVTGRVPAGAREPTVPRAHRRPIVLMVAPSAAAPRRVRDPPMWGRMTAWPDRSRAAPSRVAHPGPWRWRWP